MEDDQIDSLFALEDVISWCFQWTLPIRTLLYHRYPTTSIHPLFGANCDTIYYLPVIVEQDELESELSTEQIQIEELPIKEDGDDGVTTGEEQQQQRYIVEEPPEEEEKEEDMKAIEQKLPQSRAAKRGDIC